MASGSSCDSSSHRCSIGVIEHDNCPAFDSCCSCYCYIMADSLLYYIKYYNGLSSKG